MTPEQMACIEKLANDGALTPENVVREAKKKTSPLHELFEWDLRAAAMKHWLERARQIIRVVKVEITYENRTIAVPRYLRDPAKPAEEQGYVDVQSLTPHTPGAHQAVLYECERALASFARAERIAQALDMDAVFRSLISHTEEIKQQIEISAEQALQPDEETAHV